MWASSSGIALGAGPRPLAASRDGGPSGGSLRLGPSGLEFEAPYLRGPVSGLFCEPSTCAFEGADTSYGTRRAEITKPKGPLCNEASARGCPGGSTSPDGTPVMNLAWCGCPRRESGSVWVPSLGISFGVGARRESGLVRAEPPRIELGEGLLVAFRLGAAILVRNGLGGALAAARSAILTEALRTKRDFHRGRSATKMEVLWGPSSRPSACAPCACPRAIVIM